MLTTDSDEVSKRIRQSLRDRRVLVWSSYIFRLKCTIIYNRPIPALYLYTDINIDIVTMAGIALLGAGLFAKEGTSPSPLHQRHDRTNKPAHLPALIEHKADLRAVYSRSRSSADSLVALARTLGIPPDTPITIYSDDSSTHPLSALLTRSDITAVIIALPITTQPSVVQACLAAGKHVLCEKPIAANLSTAASLITAYETTHKPLGTHFAIAEQFRTDRAFTRARALATTRIGKIVHVHARVWSNIDPAEQANKWLETAWRKSPAYQGGFVLDGGVHFIALVRYVSGLEIVRTASLTAQMRAFLPPLDTVNAAVEFANGAAGSVSISFASRRAAFEFVFVGEEGAVVVKASKTAGESVVVLEGRDGEVLLEESIEGRGVSEEVRVFLEGVETGRMDERLDPRQAYADLAVIESVCQGGGNIRTL